MIKLFCLLVTLSVTIAHNAGANEESASLAVADEEKAPLYELAERAPWAEILPGLRVRRDALVAPLADDADTTVSVRVKKISRTVTCVVLVVAAIVELVTYFIELSSAT